MFAVFLFCFRLCGYVSIVFEFYLTDPIFFDYLTDPLFIIFRLIYHACRHPFHDFGRRWPVYKIHRRRRKLSVCATVYTRIHTRLVQNVGMASTCILSWLLVGAVLRNNRMSTNLPQRVDNAATGIQCPIFLEQEI